MARLPVQLSDASGVPYYRQIVDQVTLAVRTGQLEPGARLPSVRDLAGQLVVSLITIRRAYADLEAAGRIVRRQGQGTFVAENVAATSPRQARLEVAVKLGEVVAHARRLGLDATEIRSLLDRSLQSKGDADGDH